MDEKNTAEKFVGVPGHEHLKMYKSGDKGMRSAGGELIYLGRMVENDQVKIRGNRIELKEIENVLAGMDKIDRAVAAVKKLNGEDTIVGYYLSREEVPERSLRSYLLKYLPAPMMPGVFMRLPGLPVNVNGKLDYAALPNPEIPKSDAYVPPVNELEVRMVGIWADVLKLDKDKIGLNDDFFSLGGNSLKVVQLSQQIEAAFNRPVAVAELFDVDTISAFIKHFFNDAEEEGAEEDDSTDLILDRLTLINNIKLNHV
jgi:acyl carrier protein